MNLFEEKTRAARIAQAQTVIAQGRKYTTTRPGSDASPLIRDLCIAANDLINELQPTKETFRDIPVHSDSKSRQRQEPTRGQETARPGSQAPARDPSVEDVFGKAGE